MCARACALLSIFSLAQESYQKEEVLLLSAFSDLTGVPVVVVLDLWSRIIPSTVLFWNFGRSGSEAVLVSRGPVPISSIRLLRLELF